METHSGQHGITIMARVLSVSRSGFYLWRKRIEPGPRALAQTKLDELVAVAFAHFRCRYGAPRITRHLSEQGHYYDGKTVASSLRRQGLRAKAAKRFKVTTDSKHNRPVAKNLLEQDFTAERPNQKWAGDITYLWTDEGWVYLAVILDLFSRQVIGWAMSDRMTATLVCDALQMALWRRKMPKGVIVHSDRGSQYCSDAYRRMLRRRGLVCSMSGKGNCYDNGVPRTPRRRCSKRDESVASRILVAGPGSKLRRAAEVKSLGSERRRKGAVEASSVG
jgi:transposase InsO family protein